MNKDQILNEMMAHAGPNARRKTVEVALNRYLKVIPQYFCRGIDLIREDQTGIPIPKNKIRCDLIGRYGSRPQKYWFDWLHEHYPLFEELKKGYKHGSQKYGELTMVRPLNFTTEQLLKIESSLSDREFLEIYYPEFEDANFSSDWFFWTIIDQKSLKSFIESGQSQVGKSSNYNKTVERNVKDAQRILRVSEIMNKCFGQPWLPQRINESDFGRMYLKGINLQSVRKEVRHASLGDCHEYDLENSVFAWKYEVARQLHPDETFPATLEYIDHKSALRKRVTETVFGSASYETVIKQAITAIGFGASKANSCWVSENGSWKQSSLREIIHSPEYLKTFVEDSWVNEFIEEQKRMNRYIFDSVKDDEKLFKIPSVLANGAINKNKTVSFLYQHCERLIMERLMSVAQESQVLLLCHDALYTKKPVSMIEMREVLNEFGSHLKIKKVKHSAWSYYDDSEHIEHIRNEEKAVAEFFRQQGLTALSDEQIDRRINWKLNLNKNKRFINNSADFDNGNRMEPIKEDEE